MKPYYSDDALAKQAALAALPEGAVAPVSMLLGICEPRVKPTDADRCNCCGLDARDSEGGDWAREARVALEAALPHLQPTEPLDRALGRLATLQPDPGKQARRIEQAAMLEAAQVPDDLVAVMCKIAARGKILTDDLVAIERAGVMLGIEVAYTRRRP